MGRNSWFGFAGTAATLWAAVHALAYFDKGGPLGPGSGELPTTITVFFAIAIVAGLVGGIALAFGRRWAASLMWISWLGVLIDGAWAPGLYGDVFHRGPVDLALATIFAVIAQFHQGRRIFEVSGSA